METTDFSDATRRALKEWDEVVERKKKDMERQRLHACEIVASLEKTERRLGKSLAPYKEAFIKEC